ncbi:MAG TPA: L-asparaginase [Gammaproteobacteria bacterium]|jgi:L-asparaginase|nr:L-asparaginase [Gammaproteobacteria bacterium]
MPSEPKVVIIGTGGTIAGRADSATNLAYSAGQLSIEDLLEVIPDLANVAQISGQNLFSLNSKDMGPAQWQLLARTISEEVSRKDVSGVVITHGTDTLEEAALFLHLTLRTDKPIVLTGSMRPATALSPDGPANLFHAVQVCASAKASGRGVLVVMNGEILPALHLVKRHSIATNAFTSSPAGPLGRVYSGRTSFFSGPTKVALAGAFGISLANDVTLPAVDIHYVAAGSSHAGLLSCDWTERNGLVIAGFGSGEIPDGLVPEINRLADEGITIVVSSRVAGVVVLPETMTLTEGHHIVASRHLNPHKSALLLSLTLAAGKDVAATFIRTDADG